MGKTITIGGGGTVLGTGTINQLGKFTASDTIGDANIVALAASLSLGGDGNYNIGRPQHTSGAGGNTTYIGQQGSGSGDDGGDLNFLSGGGGGGAANAGLININIGTSNPGATNAINIGTTAATPADLTITIGSDSIVEILETQINLKSSGTLINAASTTFGLSASTVGLIRPKATTGTAFATNIVGQEAQASGVSGDINIDVGDTAGATAGDIKIGVDGSGLGQLCENMTVGANTKFSIELAATLNRFELTSAALTFGPHGSGATAYNLGRSISTASGGLTKIFGQGGASGSGGDLEIDGGDGSTTDGALKLGVNHTSQIETGGTEMFLDADTDTSIRSDTDDVLLLKFAGSDAWGLFADRLGIGTITPGDNINGGTSDYASAVDIIHLRNTSDAAAIALEGSTNGAFIDMIDLDGAADDKLMRQVMDAGEYIFRSLDDDFTLNKDNILKMDLGTGQVTMTFDLLVGSGSSKLGMFGTAPVVQQTGVAVSAAGIHAALVAYGIIT